MPAPPPTPPSVLAESPLIAATEIDVERIVAAIARRLDAGPLNLLPAAAASPLSFFGGSGFGDERPPPFALDEDGIATVSINGILLQEAFDMCGFELATGYDRIITNFAAAARADDVHAIVLAIKSPGGMAAGNLEAAAELRALADESGKPVVARCSMACSAAFALACAADEVIVYPSGMLGCIGTIASRLDISGAMAARGVREIVAAWPPGKAVQSETGAGAPEIREHMMATVRPLGTLFMDHVAARRPLSAKEVFDLDAITLIGAEAVAARLGDAVVSHRTALDSVRRRMRPRKGYSMGTQGNAADVAAQAMLVALIGAVGLDPALASTFTLEQVQAAAKVTRMRAQLGASVLALTGLESPVESAEVVAHWKRQSNEVLPATREKLKVRTAQLAVSTGRLPPSLAYALEVPGEPDKDGKATIRAQGVAEREFPAVPILAARIAGMSVESFELEVRDAAPHPATLAGPKPKPIPASTITSEMAARHGFKDAAEYQTHLAKYGPPPNAPGTENDQ